MAKAHTWTNGVKVSEDDIVEPPRPPRQKHMDRDAFEAWFISTFGTDAKTAAQIKAAWPTE